MEIRDYIVMLRRGWPVVLLFTAIGLALSFSYLAVAPKRYESEAQLYMYTSAPRSAYDLQVGLEFARNAAPTYAAIIASPEILDSVAEQLGPDQDNSKLAEMVKVEAPDSTALINITVSNSNARRAAEIANLVTTTAVVKIPQLVPAGRSSQVGIDLQIIRDASQPESAVSPNAQHVVAFGGLVAAALGLAFTIAQQALDTRLRRPEDVRSATALPLLAVIPQTRRAQRDHVVVRDDPASPVVEGYRSLRTNLSPLTATDRSSLLVTGVSPRESAMVPINLAWSMAQAGRRVLLLDLDLRRSVVGDLLQVGSASGMSDVLAGKKGLLDVTRDTSQAGLYVATSGTIQPSPSDLLSNPFMEEVLRQAETKFDIVVIHAPSLVTYTDAAVVARVAGQTLITVTSGRAKAQDLTLAQGVLSNVRVDPLGVVLVGTRRRDVIMTKIRGLTPRSETGPALKWDSLDDEQDVERRPSVYGSSS